MRSVLTGELADRRGCQPQAYVNFRTVYKYIQNFYVFRYVAVGEHWVSRPQICSLPLPQIPFPQKLRLAIRACMCLNF